MTAILALPSNHSLDTRQSDKSAIVEKRTINLSLNGLIIEAVLQAIQENRLHITYIRIPGAIGPFLRSRRPNRMDHGSTDSYLRSGPDQSTNATRPPLEGPSADFLWSPRVRPTKVPV